MTEEISPVKKLALLIHRRARLVREANLYSFGVSSFYESQYRLELLKDKISERHKSKNVFIS